MVKERFCYAVEKLIHQINAPKYLSQPSNQLFEECFWVVQLPSSYSPLVIPQFSIFKKRIESGFNEHAQLRLQLLRCYPVLRICDLRVNIGLKTRLIINILLFDVDCKIFGPSTTNVSVRASQISVTHSHYLFVTQR